MGSGSGQRQWAAAAAARTPGEHPAGSEAAGEYLAEEVGDGVAAVLLLLHHELPDGDHLLE
eukprot:SAG11_NODE_16692_length_540_cov_1.151927_1_plen_60_part_10